MKSKDLIFTGLDIPKEVIKLMGQHHIMGSVNEKYAYDCGVQNTLNALEAILESQDKEIFIHIPGLDMAEEFFIDDLIKRIDK